MYFLRHKHLLFLLFITVISISSLNAEPTEPSTGVYKEFLQKKANVEEMFKQRAGQVKADQAKALAEITSQIMEFENGRAEVQQQAEDLRSSIARQKALHSLLLLDGEWYNFPIFIIMLFLLYLILRSQVPQLSKRYHKQLLIAIGLLTFMYALGAMAKPLPNPNESRQEIVSVHVPKTVDA